jgi:hypothetical protein
MRKLFFALCIALLVAACGGDEGPGEPACAVDKDGGDCVNKCTPGLAPLGGACTTVMDCECGLTCKGDPKACVPVDTPCLCSSVDDGECQFVEDVHCPNKCDGGQGVQGETCGVTSDCACGFKCFSGECTPFTGANEGCLCNDIADVDISGDITEEVVEIDGKLNDCPKAAPGGATCNPYCDIGCDPDTEHCSYAAGNFLCMPFGDLALDELCASSQVCEQGSACFGLTGGPGDACHAFCIDDDDCPVGRKCDVTVNFNDGATSGSFCGDVTVGCDPFAPGNTCGDGAACYVDGTATKCMEAGAMAEGEICPDANSCEPGLHCMVVCTEICGLNPGQEPGCSLCGSPLYGVVVEDEFEGGNCEHGGKKATGSVDLDGAVDDVAYGCNAPPEPDAPGEIVAITSELPGANCDLGGKKIRIGVDADQDGSLGDAEVAQTEYLCHEPPTSGGAPGLANVIGEPAGDNCSAGGKKIETGTDDNGSGTLDPLEVTATSYACNTPAGDPGFLSIATVISEVAGANCADGGKKIQAGPDSDSSGLLDEAEVDYTGYACNEPPVDALGTVSDEAEGENCPDGGRVARWGLDANLDGSLGDEEVAGTHYACHKAAGVAGIDALATLTAESAGESCPYGGKKISTGGDDNQDGSLADGEVDSVTYACDATPEGIGAEAIVAVTAEQSGENCPYGGKQIDAGVDENTNGELDGEEKSNVWYACLGEPGALGPKGLVTVQTVAEESEACPYGGKTFKAGTDTDDDGALTGDEIAAEITGCNGETGLGGGEFDEVSEDNGVGVCLTSEMPAACDIFYQMGCEPGQKCAFVNGGAGCVSAGNVAIGEACGGPLGGCVAGGLCVNSTCGEICDASPEAAPEVSCDEKCSSMSNINPSIWGVGICTDQGPAVTCDFWAQDCEDPAQNCYFVTGGATCLTPNGNGQEGEPCSSLTDCGKGFTCASNTCITPCSLDEFADPPAQICADVCTGAWSVISYDAGIGYCD